MKPWVMVVALLAAFGAQASVVGESPRSMLIDAKMGMYLPLIDRAFATRPGPYETVFANQSMLLGELSFEYQVFQALGTLALGISGAYGEKFAWSVDAATGVRATESTGLRVFQFKALASYRFDYLAQKFNIPVVPYLKGALIAAPWSTKKGTEVEIADGVKGEGTKFGFGFTPGIALMIDFLDRRMARDFDTGLGVNHTYLFAEYNYQDVNDFGAAPSGLDLSSRHWTFGLAFEF